MDPLRPESGDPGGSTPPTPDSIPQIPTPFRPTEPLVGPGRGCGTPVLLGCGFGTLLLLSGMVLMIANYSKLVLWAFSQSRQAIVEKLPDDITDSERQRFEAAFDNVVQAVVDKRLDQDGLRTLSNELQSAVTRAGSGKLSRDDVRQLTEALEAIGRDENTVRAQPYLIRGRATAAPT